MTSAQRVAWLQLARTNGVGPATFRDLINHFGTAEAAVEGLPGLATRSRRAKPLRIPERSRVEDEIAAVERAGGRVICSGEPDYPAALEAYDAAPMVLQIRGSAVPMRRPIVGIVGSRASSMASAKFTGQMASELVEAGLTVASGFARGIDTAAHRATMNGGTIAVFAGGVNHIYPPENRELAAELIDRGNTIVSEMPFGYTPRAQDFPRRNRIIAGMSLAVVVVEAALRSGSLITARLANEMGRQVFAVPGSPLDPRSAGANSLLKSGSLICTEAGDILDVLGPMTTPTTQKRTLAEPHAGPPVAASDDQRARIEGALDRTPVDVDELIRFTGLPARNVQLVLLELDLAGSLVRHSGNRVSRS